MNTQPMSSRCHSSSSGVGSDWSRSVRSTSAVFATQESKRCQAAAADGDHEYIRAEAIT